MKFSSEIAMAMLAFAPAVLNASPVAGAGAVAGASEAAPATPPPNRGNKKFLPGPPSQVGKPAGEAQGTEGGSGFENIKTWLAEFEKLASKKPEFGARGNKKFLPGPPGQVGKPAGQAQGTEGGSGYENIKTWLNEFEELASKKPEFGARGDTKFDTPKKVQARAESNIAKIPKAPSKGFEGANAGESIKEASDALLKAKEGHIMKIKPGKAQGGDVGSAGEAIQAAKEGLAQASQ
ncbi:hypothetical protein AAL_00411 [Moelleriella libera RCEF 2490]|uniref:Uncharacterized protein n=1 Tax=Moelleriella libera RCEF 2490 TaxID=1081109 RepID=A0A162K466_9HYPO|nr:hypothetical protein AAL_00411 [Moelleriella libera RCEF 2490]